MIRIVFMGNGEFGIPTLRTLHENHHVAAVVTGRDTFKGRGRTLTSSPVKEAARTLGIEVIEPENLSDPILIENLTTLDADLFFVVAFRILPKELFGIPPKGTVNLHASLLPDYRGAAPINRAIINGDEVTGLTTFYIEKKVDTGDMLLSAQVSIGPDETAGELADRMKHVGAQLALDTVNGIEREILSAVKQPDTPRRPAPKLFKEHGRIDWSKDARSVHNQVRGMNPSPGAFSDWPRGPLKIHRTQIVDTESPGTPGLVTDSSPHAGFVVSCGTGKLRVLEVQPPGKKIMDAASFVRGYRIETGMFIDRKNEPQQHDDR